MRSEVRSGATDLLPSRFPPRESGWISRAGGTALFLALLSAAGLAALLWGPALLRRVPAVVPSVPSVAPRVPIADGSGGLTSDEAALVGLLNDARTDPRGFGSAICASARGAPLPRGSATSR